MCACVLSSASHTQQSKSVVTEDLLVKTKTHSSRVAASDKVEHMWRRQEEETQERKSRTQSRECGNVKTVKDGDKVNK